MQHCSALVPHLCRTCAERGRIGGAAPPGVCQTSPISTTSSTKGILLNTHTHTHTRAHKNASRCCARRRTHHAPPSCPKAAASAALLLRRVVVLHVNQQAHSRSSAIRSCLRARGGALAVPQQRAEHEHAERRGAGVPRDTPPGVAPRSGGDFCSI